MAPPMLAAIPPTFLALAMFGSEPTARFRLGRTTVNDLALDQNRLLQAELLSVEGWENAHLSFVRLCHALGSHVGARGECVESSAAAATPMAGDVLDSGTH